MYRHNHKLHVQRQRRTADGEREVHENVYSADVAGCVFYEYCVVSGVVPAAWRRVSDMLYFFVGVASVLQCTECTGGTHVLHPLWYTASLILIRVGL